MRESPLLNLLTNFSDEPPEAFVEVIPRRPGEGSDAAEAAAEIPPSPFVRREEEPKPVDVEALVAAARHEERSAARAETRRQLAAQAEENRRSAAAALQRERARWVEEQAAPIATGFADAVETMERRLGEQLESILEPFLGRAARATCIEQFEACVVEMFDACPEGTVRLRGPDDLVAAVGARLAARRVPLVTEPSEAIELTALLGDTVMETCLETFCAALGVALVAEHPVIAPPRLDDGKVARRRRAARPL